MTSRGAKGLSCLFVLACLLAGCGGGGTPPPIEGYHVRDGMIAAPEGRLIFLRGINVREDAKYHQDHLIPLTNAQLALIEQSGFDSVRYLVSWEALMPQPGVIDADYLGRLETEVARLDDAGFFIVLDMHQDLWGDPFGNGAPAWACPDELKEGYEPQQPWWSNYFSEQVTACFDNFWQSAGLQQHYASAWQAVAQRLCGLERVVGFDLMNEPFTGSSFGHADADNAILVPFYSTLMQAISEVCPDRVFFLEPSRAYDFGLSDPLEIPAAWSDRAVLAPHFYPPEVHEPGQGYGGDAASLAQTLDDLYGDYGKDGIPVWIGELGGLTENPGYSDYLVDLQQIMFDRLWGGALWAWSKGDGGFSFLDSAGRRKPVFDAYCSVPVPVMLPSRPNRLSGDFTSAGLEIELGCKRDSSIEILLPGEGRWEISYDPAGALGQPVVNGSRLELPCAGDFDLSVSIVRKQG